MAMGKKPAARQRSPMWVTTADLPTSAGHPFFERLNRVLETAGFDAFVEGLCAAFYADRHGRPSLRPGRYFRLLFIGYFEGLSSERGIAWRVADSLSLRAFLDLDVGEQGGGGDEHLGSRPIVLVVARARQRVERSAENVDGASFPPNRVRDAFAHGKLPVRLTRCVSPYPFRSRSFGNRTIPVRTLCFRQSHWRSRRVACSSIAA